MTINIFKMGNVQNFGLAEINKFDSANIFGGTNWPYVIMDSSGRLYYFFQADNGRAEYHPSETYVC